MDGLDPKTDGEAAFVVLTFKAAEPKIEDDEVTIVFAPKTDEPDDPKIDGSGAVVVVTPVPNIDGLD